MQILVLSGSRNRKGQTARGIEAICKGIMEAKGQSEVLFLPEFNLERCRQCDADGWGICHNEGWCVIKDDFASIVEKIKAADALVFTTPVYFSDLSDSLRGFLDRYRRTRFPTLSQRPSMPSGQPLLEGGATPAIGYGYAGGSGNGTIACLFTLEKLLLACGFDVVDMIPARRQNLEMKLPYLERVGQWLVTKPASGPWPIVPAK